MLKLENIDKEFNNKKIIKGLNFSVNPGEVIGFLGPNGAGKTTTMRMIATLLEPESGRITLDDKDIREQPLKTRRRLGYLPENNPLYEDMLVIEYLQHMAELKELRGIEKHKAITKVVKQTGISDVYFRPINELSKGYRQRVGLAQAIMHEPDILILDEPTEGLDPNQRVQIRNLIKEIGKERTVIISTHVLQEVVSTCSRVVIIHQGKIVADSSVDELIKQSQGKLMVNLEIEGLSDTKQLLEIAGVDEILEEKITDNRLVCTVAGTGNSDLRPLIFDAACRSGWRIWDMHKASVSLEDIFRELTSE